MDDMLSQAVKEAFVRFYDEGLIYRSNRLVNWSCKLLTAISDVELEHLELTGPTKLAVPGHTGYYEFGVLINFEYKIRDDPSGRGIVVATTRIETMLGDVAVAVHPDDERYKDLHGKELVHPFIPDRKMHVITDAVLVDMNLGTGAVKITPAHDPNDFNCGLRHHLEQINIFNDDGTINDNGGSYAGLKRYDARKKIIEDLKSLGLLRGKTPNPMVLSICQRSKDIVEPLLRP
jgi:valyl-tRNA synthetase